MADPAPGRFVSKEGRSNLVKLGLTRAFFTDLYHSWLVASWRRVFGLVIALYLLLNGVFALLYLAVGGVENAQPGSFSDAFFFSVQTLATIGYGRMSPVTIGAHLLVTVEAFCGITGVALITGLMFAKFARPTARVLWSDVCVVAMQDGVPSLMLRVANARGNQVVEAQLRLGLLSSEITAEASRCGGCTTCGWCGRARQCSRSACWWCTRSTRRACSGGRRSRRSGR